MIQLQAVSIKCEAAVGSIQGSSSINQKSTVEYIVYSSLISSTRICTLQFHKMNDNQKWFELITFQECGGSLCYDHFTLFVEAKETLLE